MSPLLQSDGTARYSPDSNGNGWSPRWINAALLTIATRRSDNGGPATNGVVSKLGHGRFATAVRVGSGMSSSRAMHASFVVIVGFGQTDAENTMSCAPDHSTSLPRSARC